MERASPETVTVHIDTSLQIEQQKEEAQAKPVRDRLSLYVFTSTSTYARREFKRAWLQDLNLIYKVSKDCKQIGDVYTNIHRSLWSPQVQRRLNRCVSAINAFLTKQDPSKVSIGVAVVKLRAHIAEAILGGFMWWDRSVVHQYNGTSCIRSTERPARASDGTMDVSVRECRPTKIQCTVHKMFEERRAAFEAIAAAIEGQESPSKELQKTSETIRKATSSPVYLCDSKNCTAMSDALIAVDGIASTHFAANNDKEWETISHALGKQLVNPVREAKERAAS